MRTVRVCGPVAKVVRTIADEINGPNVTAPKAIEAGGVVFLITDDPLTLELTRHEMRHEKQAADLQPKWIPMWGPLEWLREAIGWSRFYSQYAVEFGKHGYWDNRFEVDARKASGEQE